MPLQLKIKIVDNAIYREKPRKTKGGGALPRLSETDFVQGVFGHFKLR